MSKELNNEKEHPDNTSLALDDEQRVKVLSPGMLVAKRFLRNKLAVAGLVIIVAMFLFSFLGGVVSPYGESQVFRTTEATWKDYAGASYNDTYRFQAKDGASMPAAAQQRFILAEGKGEESFEAGGIGYSLKKAGEDLYLISAEQPIATVLTLKGKSSYKETGDIPLTDEIKKAYEAAEAADEDTFEADGISYSISQSGRQVSISCSQELALATKKIFNAASEENEEGYDFQRAALEAMEEKADSFTVGEEEFTLEEVEGQDAAEIKKDGEIYATVSTLLVSPQTSASFLSLDFKEKVETAIAENAASFTADNGDGTEITYQLQKKNTQYVIRSQKETTVNATFEAPGRTHLLGTDGNGMDMLTRLMYGGRISLLIGFVVILIEIVIGVLIGGISGYFGGWIDTLMMRLVDVVICIPSMPLYIIIGAVMDYYQVDPRIRIYLLCALLGLLTWPSMARMVRGQILSLREQEFMIATEATGIRISRRIFRHLLPNVIPQLIVMATMGLGDVILTEATLSFLGIGVKFPFASWGNIVNAVNDIYVLTNYWFVWIPAGFLILITVLGFNFIGDGLRDAFDPKMKR
ncbi:MAG: ABC transporter permease [Lachnospiraceae bacterium]|nr:ABC transporter permease [Lachnospiraceae bacterium]